MAQTTDIGRAVWNAMPEEVRRDWERAQARRQGAARQQLWDCADGWIVGYTTERVRGGGDLEGRFVTLAYRPIGKGSQSGNPQEWKLVYKRGFAKRKTARTRAEAIYNQHRRKARA